MARKAPWHETPQAKAILSRLTAADVHIAVRTPIMGNRHYVWVAGAASEKLDDLRSAGVAAAFGCGFNEACEQGRAREYLDAYNAQPSVEDVLAERFGSPARFGRPTDHVIDCDRGAHANALWRLERDGASVGEAA